MLGVKSWDVLFNNEPEQSLSMFASIIIATPLDGVFHEGLQLTSS